MVKMVTLFILFTAALLFGQKKADEAEYLNRFGEKENGSPAVLSFSDETIPGSFKLEQNYPNPFNPETVIKFELPEKTFATLKVYNLLGKEVAELFKGSAEAGKYEVYFNSADSQGNQLPSGIYIYQLSTEDFTASKKMTLLK